MNATRMTRLLALIGAIAAFSLIAAGCGDDDESTSSDTGAATTTETSTETTTDQATSGGGGTTAPRAEKVEIVDFSFNPDPVTIAVGGKITWLNQDSAPHTATAEDDSFDTGTLDQGKLKSETFKEAGTYTYICSIHPTMHGTVEVVE